MPENADTTPRPAVFLDRDGTIIEAVHYLRDPAAVRLLPGAAAALRELRAAGLACVVVTNQSAIGRGLLTVEGFHAVQAELHRQLDAEGAALDATYFCPTVPASDDRTTIDDPDRKPGPGMLLRAAADLGLDLARSWMVGDMPSDVLAGRNAGCRGSLFVACGQGRPEDVAELDCPTLPDLAAAARHILLHHRTPHAHTRETTTPCASS
jgi:D-glycero-D-manno-heptose 1,7-bisphosphate phosphatase